MSTDDDVGRLRAKSTAPTANRNHPTRLPMMLGYNFRRYAKRVVALRIDEPALLPSSFILDIFFLCQTPRKRRNHLADQSSTTGLDGFNLSQVDGCSAESCWKLRDIEEDSRRRADRTKLGSRGAANAAFSAADGLLERSVLLGMITVGAE